MNNQQKTNNKLDDLLLPLRQKILAVVSMDCIIPDSDDQILKFALRSELQRLHETQAVVLPLREQIKLRMREQRMTGITLAGVCGVSDSKMSRYLSGTGKLNSDEIEILLTTLKML